MSLLPDRLLNVLKARAASDDASAPRSYARSFPGPGLFVAVLGFDDARADLEGSLYERTGAVGAEPLTAAPAALRRKPSERDQAVEECLAELLQRALCVAAEPIAAGGLLSALGVLCAGEVPVGCAVVLQAPRRIGARPPTVEEQLFHEATGRILIAVPADRQADARILASEHGVPLWPLGRTGGKELVVRAADPDAPAPPGQPGAFSEVLRMSVALLPRRGP